MFRSLRLVSLTVVLAGFSACGSTDTELGAEFDPLNGSACGTEGAEENGCVCASDQRWLCAGQNSVTCSGIYGSGGGRLLVSVDMPCEMSWGWPRGCNDGRTYGAKCDGLRCQCDVDGVPGASWFTPRCAEMPEANAQCGWSLKLPDGASTGNAPAQGHACETVGAHDDESNCTCFESGWDCQAVAGCFVSGSWSTAEGVLSFAPYGTFIHAATLGVSRFDILEQRVAGFLGTWELAPPYLFIRSTHSPLTPSCDDTFGTYEFSFDEACGTLSLTLVEDTCAPRAAALGAFHGVN
jgi:hypothetical protein